MSLTERVFHALLFEAGVIGLSVWLVSAFTVHDSGLLTGLMVLLSLIAVAWNMLFNLAFDRIFTGQRTARRFSVRLLHTVAFELGLLLFTLPLVVWMLQIGWWEALVIDSSLTIFVMFYTFIFNWLYDHIREWLQKITEN